MDLKSFLILVPPVGRRHLSVRRGNCIVRVIARWPWAVQFIDIHAAVNCITHTVSFSRTPLRTVFYDLALILTVQNSAPPLPYIDYTCTYTVPVLVHGYSMFGMYRIVSELFGVCTSRTLEI